MSRLVPGLALALLIASSPTFAQDGVIVGRRFVGATRQFGADLGPVPDDLTWPLIGGGRFAVRETADRRDILDRRTGATVALPANSVVIALDPVRPRVFVLQYSHAPVLTAVVAVFDAATGAVTPLAAVDPTGLRDIARYAVDADTLFVVTSRAATEARTIAVVDATTGVSRGPDVVIHSSGWDVTPDGADLFTATWADAPEALRGPVRIDVATGQIIAMSPAAAPLDFQPNVRWHPELEALVADDSRAFDRQLRPLGAIGRSGFCMPVLQVSSHTRRIYVKTGGGSTTYARFPEWLTAIDPSTGRWTSVNLDVTLGLGGSGCSSGLTVLSAPGAPRNLRAGVTGHDVALQWESIGAASHFVLDVGLAPGRTDASVFLAPTRTRPSPTCRQAPTTCTCAAATSSAADGRLKRFRSSSRSSSQHALGA